MAKFFRAVYQASGSAEFVRDANGNLEYLDHSAIFDLTEVWDDSGRRYYPDSDEWEEIEEQLST